MAECEYFAYSFVCMFACIRVRVHVSKYTYIIFYVGVVASRWPYTACMHVCQYFVYSYVCMCAYI